jgi:hypothetical protein
MQGLRQEIHHEEQNHRRSTRRAMTHAIAKAEVEFRVGEVRVSIWHNPAQDEMQSGHAISIEHKNEGRGTAEPVATLPAEHIPKAILALKKAHDYLQMRKSEGQPPQDFQPATERAPERIP